MTRADHDLPAGHPDAPVIMWLKPTDNYDSEGVRDDLHWPACVLGMLPKGWANALRHRALALRAGPCFTVPSLRASIAFACVAIAAFNAIYFGLQLLRGVL